MFDQLVIRRPLSIAGKAEIGLIAESLLFYDRVDLVLERGSLSALIEAIGIDTTLKLIDDKHISITYINRNYSTLSNSIGGLRHHKFLYFTLSSKGKKTSAREDAFDVLHRTLKDPSAKRKISRLLDAIHFYKMPDQKLLNGGIEAIAQQELLSSPSEVISGVRLILDSYLGTDAPKAFRFSVIPVDDSFVIDTDLDFAALNRIYKKKAGIDEEHLKPPFLATHFLDARVDAFLASVMSSSFVATTVSAKIMTRRFTDLVRRRNMDAHEIDLFQESVLPEGRSIREAIDNGYYTFDQFLSVLERSNKFKSWLGEQSPHSSLLAEYQRAVASETWVEKLPFKTLKWVFATGLSAGLEGYIGGGTGVAAGLAGC